MTAPSLQSRVRLALRIEATTRPDGPRTKVTLAAVHLPAPGSAGPARFRITTELDVRLSAASFDRGLAAKVNNASRDKGRVLYAVDLEMSEVVAALAYHLPIDRSESLLVTALAPRIDSAAEVGRALLPVVKACLHEVAVALGRGGQLALRTGGADADEARRWYGFRPGRHGKGRPSSLLVQDAPSED
jgi:hypothetical protein